MGRRTKALAGGALAVIALTAAVASSSASTTPASGEVTLRVAAGDTWTKIANEIAPTASAADRATFARVLACTNALDTDCRNDSLTTVINDVGWRIVYFPSDVPSPAATTTTAAPTTTEVAPSTSSTSTVEPTTSTVAATTTDAPITSSTATPTTTIAATTTTAPPSGAAFSEAFTDPAQFVARFDHGWSGELHAGSLFGADVNGWPGDHDMACGNPNMTHRTITLGPGAMGENSPASSSDPAFYPCLPGGNPDAGHLMTSANTEGYVIAWFSPKPTFTNVRKVCFDNNLNFIGNGIWFQLVFLTPAEAARKPVIDGRTVNVLDLGYTSPDFPNTGGPSTPQGTAGSGVKFMVNDNGDGHPKLIFHAWDDGFWQGDANGVQAGPATTDKAPRYQICTTDNGNGTLTIVNGSPDGTVHTSTIAGSIPDGTVRVVLEQDEYNPDKHHTNAGGVGTNTGEGYTYHWDNVLVTTS